MTSNELLTRRGFTGAMLLSYLSACLGPLRHQPQRIGRGPVVDAHTHIFNATDLPVAGFAEQLTGNILAGVVGALVQALREGTDVEDDVLEQILKAFEAELVALDTGAESELALLDKIGADQPDEIREELARPLELDLSNTATAKELTDRAVPEELLTQLGIHTDAVPAPKKTAGAPGKVEKALITVRRIMVLIRLISRYRITIAGTLARTYPHVSLFMPALIDYDRWLENPDQDKAKTPVYEQLEVHRRISLLAADGRVPWDPSGCKTPRNVALFHGYVPFCPRREAESGPTADKLLKEGGDYEQAVEDISLDKDSSSLEIVIHGLERCGFIGVKLYPPVGFLPYGNARKNKSLDEGGFDRGQGRTMADDTALDTALDAFYTYATKHDIPILAHCSAGNAFTDVKRDIAGPEGWRLALVNQKYPKLRVCLAHFLAKHGNDWSTYTKVGETKEFQHDWAQAAVALIKPTNHVYVDMSNARVQEDPAFAQLYFERLGELMDRNPELPDRIMWGSDYWLNHLRPDHLHFREHTEERFDEYFSRKWTHRQVDRRLAKLMGVNALRFTGLFDSGGAKASKHPTRRRLEKFYANAGQALPWLLQIESIEEMFA